MNLMPIECSSKIVDLESYFNGPYGYVYIAQTDSPAYWNKPQVYACENMLCISANGIKHIVVKADKLYNRKRIIKNIGGILK